ncbi:MAG: hypothetical protein ACKV19_24010 [Verrucomicrobiales bacterium]
MNDLPDGEGSGARALRPALVFDWKHRPRTWARLSFWLALVLLGHLTAFIVFRVRTATPARVLPVPSTLVLAPPQAIDPVDPAGHTVRAGLLSADETADLGLPEHEPTEPHIPNFANRDMTREPWPKRPEPAAWPEVSRVSQPVLPPARSASANPASPNPTPATPTPASPAPDSELPVDPPQ